MGDDSAGPGSAETTNGKTVSPPVRWQGEMPVLYKNPQILQAEVHKSAGLRDIPSFAFARETNSVPLGADELFVAQASYPVVFTDSDPPIPVAVLGIGMNRNMFVSETGQWQAGAYIPAYVRRYPFILAEGLANGDAALAIDAGSEGFSASEGRPFFEQGAPSALTRQALEFCRAFQSQFEISRAFGNALREADILVSRRADVRQTDGKTLTLDHFRIIDEAKLDALSNDTFLAWRRNGWLGLVYAHLMSMRKWQSFVG